MKKLALSLLLFSVSALAQPKYLEGATVTVTLKNGKKYKYTSSEYAVVPRQNLQLNALKVAGFDTLHKKIVKKELVENRKNRVFGLVGRGLTGDIKVSTNGSRYELEQEERTVLGVGYQRSLTEEFNLGIIIQDNKNTSLSLGIDF